MICENMIRRVYGAFLPVWRVSARVCGVRVWICGWWLVGLGRWLTASLSHSHTRVYGVGVGRGRGGR